jgi:RNA polymerase sigma-70 factor (ECF subfamily)
MAHQTNLECDTRTPVAYGGVEVGMPGTEPVGLLADESADPIQQCDQRLVYAAQSGCRTAFNELFSLYSRRVYRTVFAITKNSEDAEDAMQDSFLRAFLAINRFESRSTFYSWLTRIAINSALMILRKRRTRPEFSLSPAYERNDEITSMDFEDSAPDPEQTYCQSQRHSTLIHAIHKLSPSLRDVVRAHLIEECSVRELALKFNISEAAAKSRLYRARIRLGASSNSRYGPGAEFAVRGSHNRR